jgi:hypothetical protein
MRRKDRMRSILCCLAVQVLLSAPAIASVLTDGSPGFSMEMDLEPTRVESAVYRLVVDCWSVRHGRDVVGKATISLPVGISLVSGDLRREFFPNRRWVPLGGKWDVLVKVDSPGKRTIRGYFWIYSGPQTVDETETVLECTVPEHGRPESATSRPVRFERVENGSRFRYGGSHMVAIDQPEAITWDDVAMGARVISSATGSCHECGKPGKRVVSLVVTVDSSGRVRWIKPSGKATSAPEARVLAAAHEAVKNWTFTPAITGKGTPVNSPLEVEVTVDVLK